MMKTFEYPVFEIIPVAKNTSRIFIKADDQFKFLAGQYVEVTHSPYKTFLSIANKIEQNHILEFHLSHSSKNAEAMHLRNQLLEKRMMTISEAMGNCTIERFSDRQPIIFLAHGTGFAPVKSIIETLVELHYQASIYFYWSAFRQEDFYLQELMRSWQTKLNEFSMQYFYDESTQQILQNILHAHPDLSCYKVYASGSILFVQAARDQFIKNNLTKKNFISDIA